jgi:hypothetical protein
MKICQYSSDNKEYATHRLLLGTHTSDGEPNHLMVAEVKLPTDDTPIDPRKYDDQRGGMVLLRFYVRVALIAIAARAGWIWWSPSESRDQSEDQS